MVNPKFFPNTINERGRKINALKANGETRYDMQQEGVLMAQWAEAQSNPSGPNTIRIAYSLKVF